MRSFANSQPPHPAEAARRALRANHRGEGGCAARAAVSKGAASRKGIRVSGQTIGIVLALAAALAVALLTLAASAQSPPPVAADKRAGSAFLTPALRAQQEDEDANPGMLWVTAGEKLWTAPAPGGKACAECHGDAASSMKGVAARYPLVDAATGKLLNLELRINQCRVERQGQPALAYESDPLLGLTAFVAHQSRGVPMNVNVDGQARPYFEAGRGLYATRQGQLNLSCAQCHDDNWGRRLRGDVISQGHPTGFPVYRLEWQAAGSLHRRLRVCSQGVRAEPYDFASPEYLALELYLAWRANGLPIDTPAVRR
jgi:L-cysteine S-thiosulfotransferase